MPFLFLILILRFVLGFDIAILHHASRRSPSCKARVGDVLVFVSFLLVFGSAFTPYNKLYFNTIRPLVLVFTRFSPKTFVNFIFLQYFLTQKPQKLTFHTYLIIIQHNRVLVFISKTNQKLTLSMPSGLAQPVCKQHNWRDTVTTIERGKETSLLLADEVHSTSRPSSASSNVKPGVLGDQAQSPWKQTLVS